MKKAKKKSEARVGKWFEKTSSVGRHIEKGVCRWEESKSRQYRSWGRWCVGMCA